MQNKRTGAKWLGALLGVLLALLLGALALRGMSALLLGALQAGSEPSAPARSFAPTMPPLKETIAPEESEEPLWSDPVELPVVLSPEELAETAVDETPPPDAPVG